MFGLRDRRRFASSAPLSPQAPQASTMQVSALEDQPMEDAEEGAEGGGTDLSSHQAVSGGK